MKVEMSGVWGHWRDSRPPVNRRRKKENHGEIDQFLREEPERSGGAAFGIETEKAKHELNMATSTEWGRKRRN